MSGTGIDVVPNLLKCPVTVLMLYRSYRSVRYRYESLYRYRRYRYRYRLSKCPVPVLTSYRTYRFVRCPYRCCTELTEGSGTGMKVCTGTGGTGIRIAPNLPKCSVPVIPTVYTCCDGAEHDGKEAQGIIDAGLECNFSSSRS